MSSKADGLLTQIETGVLDTSVSLSSLLQKVIMLGGRAGSDKMRDWARRELNGYGKASVPEYRQLQVPVYAQLSNRAGTDTRIQRITKALLPDAFNEARDIERLPLGIGVAELEGYAAGGDPLQLSSADYSDGLIRFLNASRTDEQTSVLAVYWELPNAMVRGVLARARTALAELVADLAQGTPDGEDVPSKATADQAMKVINNHFHGDANVAIDSTNVNQSIIRTDSSTNVSAPNANTSVVATGNSTAIGTQTASGEGSSVVGAQKVEGAGATVTGRDNTTTAPKDETKGFWGRLRKRGLFVALFTVVGGIAGVLALIVGVAVWLDWKP